MRSLVLYAEQVLLNAISTVAYSVYPYIGKGERYKNIIDSIATRYWEICIQKLSNELGCEFQAISIEGERDGIVVSDLQMEKRLCPEKFPIALDPIDGTLAGATGCSRCVTAIALSFSPNRMFKVIPDSLSCFSMASNFNRYFVEDFSLSLPDEHDKTIIGTINRSDSQLIWQNLLEKENVFSSIGETGFFLPTCMGENVFFAGDTSIPIFMECDHFIGRTGASESRIESRLWKYWSGILVSSKKMKEDPLGYLNKRMQKQKACQKKNVFEFFEKCELESLYSCGWEDDDILRIHSKETYAPDFDITMIGAITGTRDSILSQHSLNNLKGIHVDEISNSLQMDVLIVYKNGVRKIVSIPVQGGFCFGL